MKEENESSVYTFSPEEFQKRLADWHRNEWPVQLLLRDHYSAKILQDNAVFDSIKFYGHEWKWDEEEGLLILYKPTLNSIPSLSKWTDILPNIQIKVTATGEFLFDGASYGEEGLEHENNFQFNASEFKDQLNKWIQEGWPVQFLLRDHYGAKVLFDNQVFQLIEFYGHSWKWDDEKGLSLLFKETLSSKTRWAPWTEIVQYVPICRTAQGWLLFDGWIYGQEGIIPVHLWQWKKLVPNYIFSAPKRPSYCYVDMVTFNWEHDGMPGIGVSRTPHGHTSVEFGDDLGNFYSVGMYMDPRSRIDMKKTPAATLKAVLMSPDPYLSAKGEKAVHRYCLGRGKVGRENISKLKKHIEELQGWRKNPDTGIVSTCRKFKYHTFKYNCGDFQKGIEKFTREELHGELIEVDNETLLPFRQKVENKQPSWWQNLIISSWNKFLLFFVDSVIFLASNAPWVSSKIGVGMEDDFSDFEEQSNEQTTTTGEFTDKSGLTLFLFKNLGSFLHNLKPKHKPVSFPRRHRLEQLYSPRLKKYSAILKT